MAENHYKDVDKNGGKGGANTVESQTNTAASFQERLDANPQIQNIADEYAFTPPIPLANTNRKVVVFAYMQTDRTTAAPKVLPPRYKINADFPALKVIEIESIKQEQLGLTLMDNRYLGLVQLPDKYKKMPYDEFANLKKEFERLYSASVEAYFDKKQQPVADCRRVIELLPIFASEPLIPLLQKINPSFFEEIKNCSK